MTGITRRFVRPIGLVMSLLPLALTGCGNTGSSSAVKEHAFLTPPPLEQKQAASVSLDKTSDGKTNKTKLATTASGKKAPEIVGPVVASKAKKTKVAIAKTSSKLSERSHRKAPRKKAAKKIEKKKLAIKKPAKIKKVMAKAVDKPKIQARAKPGEALPSTAVSPVVATVPKVKMVPETSIPAQVASDDTPQDIIDAFKEDMGVKALERMVPETTTPEKVAKVESVPVEPSFGKSEYRFSGQ